LAVEAIDHTLIVLDKSAPDFICAPDLSSPPKPLIVGDRVMVEFDSVDNRRPIAVARCTDEYVVFVSQNQNGVLRVNNPERGRHEVTIPANFMTIRHKYPGYAAVTARSSVKPGDTLLLRTQYSPSEGRNKAFFVARLS
jgi:hypothetical protein